MTEFHGNFNGNGFKIYNIFNTPLITSLHDAQVYNLTIDTFSASTPIFLIVSNTVFTNVTIKSVNIQGEQQRALIQLSVGQLTFNLSFIQLSVSSESSYLISQQSFGEMNILSSYINFIGTNFVGLSYCQTLNIQQSEIHISSSNTLACRFFNSTQAQITNSIITFQITFGQDIIYNELSFNQITNTRISFESNGQSTTGLDLYFDDRNVSDSSVKISGIGLLQSKVEVSEDQEITYNQSLVVENIINNQINQSKLNEVDVSLSPIENITCSSYPCTCNSSELTGIFCTECVYTYLQDYGLEGCPTVNNSCQILGNTTYIYCNCQQGWLQLDNKTCINPADYSCSNGGTITVSGNDVICECINNFNPETLCQNCLDQYQFMNNTCVQQINTLNGECYDINGTIQCLSCNSGYNLVGNQCQQKTSDSVYIGIAFVCIMVVILIISIVFLAIEIKKGRKPKYLNYDPLKVKKMNNMQAYSYMQVVTKNLGV